MNYFAGLVLTLSSLSEVELKKKNITSCSLYSLDKLYNKAAIKLLFNFP